MSRGIYASRRRPRRLSNICNMPLLYNRNLAAEQGPRGDFWDNWDNHDEWLRSEPCEDFASSDWLTAGPQLMLGD